MNETLALTTDVSAKTKASANRQIAAKFFRGLGDPIRLHILDLLIERERNVSELVAELGASQSCVSNHLACLRWCGYVVSRREGRSIYYSVADPAVRDLYRLAENIIARNAQYILECARI